MVGIIRVYTLLCKQQYLVYEIEFSFIYYIKSNSLHKKKLSLSLIKAKINCENIKNNETKIVPISKFDLIEC
jgi:hypothetical protein